MANEGFTVLTTEEQKALSPQDLRDYNRRRNEYLASQGANKETLTGEGGGEAFDTAMGDKLEEQTKSAIGTENFEKLFTELNRFDRDTSKIKRQAERHAVFKAKRLSELRAGGGSRTSPTAQVQPGADKGTILGQIQTQQKSILGSFNV